jgi:hypothetical protein
LFSYQINNGKDLLTLQTNAYNVLRVTSNGDIMSSSTGGFFSGGADLAENYSSTQNLQPGQVVIGDRGNAQYVIRSTAAYQSTILGVVSTTPGFVAGSQTTDSFPIALVGRVPVNITDENGPIHAGDYLTSSSTEGYAMRATQAGRALGTALEDMDPSNMNDCAIPVYVNGHITKCGSIMVFVNLVSYSGASIEMLMEEDLAANQNIDSTGMTPADANSDTLTLNPALSDGLSAPSAFQSTKQGKILAFLEKIKNLKNISATNFSEIFTDRVASAVEVITPQVYTAGLTVDTISSVRDAISIQSDLIFYGRPYFSTDTAGFAQVVKGERSIEVVFDKEYLEQPIVNVTITLNTDPLLKTLKPETDQSKIDEIKKVQEQAVKDLFDVNVQYLVINKSEKGFTVILKDVAKQDIMFSWIALAVKGAKTFTLKDPTVPQAEVTAPVEPVPTSLPAESGSSSEVITPPAETSPAPATETPIETPDASPPPANEPPPSETPAPSPAPEATPTPEPIPAPSPAPVPEVITP